jgi:hypothetical protein
VCGLTKHYGHKCANNAGRQKSVCAYTAVQIYRVHKLKCVKTDDLLRTCGQTDTRVFRRNLNSVGGDYDDIGNDEKRTENITVVLLGKGLTSTSHVISSEEATQ